MFYNKTIVRRKIEIMKQALWKFDENLDDSISKEELLKFLDSNMQDNKKFDRALAEKIFSIFDIDQSGLITIDEFIKTFLHIEEELKAHKAHITAKYQAEKDKMDDLKKKANFYKDEQMNNEGLASNAKLTVDICSFEIDEKSYDNKFNSIKIRLTLGEHVFATRTINVIDDKINEINEKVEL